jgi:hypothetical protein
MLIKVLILSFLFISSFSQASKMVCDEKYDYPESLNELSSKVRVDIIGVDQDRMVTLIAPNTFKGETISGVTFKLEDNGNEKALFNVMYVVEGEISTSKLAIYSNFVSGSFQLRYGQGCSYNVSIAL